MSNQTTINSFEEALRIMWLQSAQGADIDISERELKLILTSPDDTFEMDKDKKVELINKLFETVNSPSVGSIISNAMISKELDQEALAKESKIPLNMLRQLISDEIFPNNVPVILLNNILNKLDISIESVREPAVKTFNLMKAKEYMNLDTGICRIAARKQQDDGETTSIGKKGENKGRELFENRESLEKYLKKLEELRTNSQV